MKKIFALACLLALTGCEEFKDLKDFKISGDFALFCIGVILFYIAHMLGKIQNIIWLTFEKFDSISNTQARLTEDLRRELSRISDRLEIMGDDEMAIKKRKERKEVERIRENLYNRKAQTETEPDI